MIQLFVSFRYLWRRGVTVFALLSVALGASAFIIVMGVMDGYSVEFNRRSRNMMGDVVVNMPGYAIRMADLKIDQLTAQPGIEAAAANIREFGLLKIPKAKAVAGKRFAVEWCHFIGIDPETQLRVVRPKLEPKLKPADFTVVGDGQLDWVVLGSDLMKSHNLAVGDEVWLVTSRQTGLGPVRRKRKLTVIGSLSFGLFEYDSEVAYISRRLAAEVRGAPPESATEIRVRLKEGVDLAEGVRQARLAIASTDQIRRLYTIRTFSETSNMFRAIESQRSLSRFILFFLFVVSGLAIVAVLFLIVLQKRHDIAVLRALGLSSVGVAGTFLTYAGVTSIVGSGAGILIGWGVLSQLNPVREFVEARTGFDPFPAHLYHLDRIPWVIEPTNPVMIIVVALVISLLAGVVPALWAAALDPVEGLRRE